MAWLTKSRFLSGLQCPKRLWFEVNQPLEQAEPDSIPKIQGRAFDQIVREIQPGVVISRDKGMPAAIAETSRVMQAGGAPVLYQPAFRHGDLAVIADVLRQGRKPFELVEVKASTRVKDEHLPDATFQTLVLRGAKVPVSSVFIGHVDNTFVLEHPGDYAGLMVEEDVTRAVEASLQNIAELANEHLAVMASPEVPDIAMGPQCTRPYECPFIARCTKERGEVPEYPVELLPRGTKQVALLRAEGFEDLRLVPADRLTSDRHRRVHAATVSGTPFFDADATRALRELPFPRAYLDFETMAYAVPEIVGTRPYEQWPFQWSLHIEESSGETRHAEFLDVDSFGDFDRLAGALLDALPSSGPVFVYSVSMERGVLKRLAERLPERAALLRGLMDRLFDLRPVTEEAYYHRDMRGSWSIKSVLPTIAPELGYEELKEVREGEGAQLAFLELRGKEITAPRREQLMLALREYCRRDTWAMLVLRKFLVQQRKPDSV
jgi:hypothetical protein